MLEPLIVLTVLNCFFMFSSTVTTCALWWQYRSHRCCFKKDPRDTLSKLKSTYASKASKKSGSPRQDEAGRGSPKQTEKPIVRRKSNSTVNRETKNRRTSKLKANSNSRHPTTTINSTSEERVTSMETIGKWDPLEERTRMSEASQTANERKSAVVMEYSTVQKIVQILDNDSDLTATKLAIRDFNAKQTVEEKKPDAKVNEQNSEAVVVLAPVYQS
ncbi:uncharacterized protein LOC143346420 [Colletes latitarsis]|uniref:uncharacterized protein LOC143346420 n=1 Tax=Colletes latitarsis TaxID=2605962 RepID=UPI0040361EE0